MRTTQVAEGLRRLQNPAKSAPTSRTPTAVQLCPCSTSTQSRPARLAQCSAVKTPSQASSSCESMDVGKAAAQGSSVLPDESLPGLNRRAVLAGGVVASLGALDWPAMADRGFEASASTSSLASSGQQAYIDIKVDGKPFGRLTFELFPDVKVGSQRFADLCQGKQGVGYRLSKFDNINQEYIRNVGVKQLAYSASGVSPIAGGESVGDLEEELAQQTRHHDTPGLVSLIVKLAEERPVVEKLVAIGGKLVTVRQEEGEVPNGTAFMITRGAAPELDATNLIVGRLVGGQDILDKMGALPVINDNQTSPFFQTGKAIGDKRALVAEKSFNKPFGKVVVAAGGVSRGLVAST